MSEQQETKVHGGITHIHEPARRDFLFRVSLKAAIFNDKGEVLVVKEVGRDWWDLPGGGMDHGESLKDAIGRELYEEISLKGDFTYDVIKVEDPGYISSLNLYQTRLIFVVRPESLNFEAGSDSDEIQFINPEAFKDSELRTERSIYQYAQLAARHG